MIKVYFFFIPILGVLIGCTEQEKGSIQSIDDSNFRNEAFLWWEDSNGNGSWIEVSDDGLWKPTTGELTQFYDNGTKKLTRTYSNGMMNGLYQAWNIEGQLVIETKLVNNRPDSVYQIFYPDGQVRIRSMLKDSRPHEIKVFNRKGVEIAFLKLSCSEIDCNVKELQKLFYPNGNPKIVYENKIRTIYDSMSVVIEQTSVEEISLHYVEVVSQFVKYYSKTDNFAVPMPDITGCVDGDCENGNGVFVDDLGAIYSGDFNNGFLNGDGTICLTNRDTMYSGQFKNGMFHGKGTYSGESVKYIGQFENDLYCGLGRIYFPDGSKYIGNFKNDMFNGEGVYIESDGSKIRGIWKDNLFIEEIDFEIQ